ncbi:MAG: PEP-CTERM sorting domain-containing protein [Acidobacteriota bacterium]
MEAKTDYYCCGTFSQASSVAEFATTFTISGAGGQPIPVSLNFNLEGLAFKREGGYWAIFVDAFPFGTGSVDSNGATSGFLGGALVNDGDLVASGLVVTPEVMLLPNTLINFLFRLTAVSISAGQTSLSHVEFADTASLPLTGPVFNLPDGYTVDIPDLFVANNRYLPPGGAGVGGEVPEPATFTTAAAGLAVLALVMRRRRD